MDVGPNTRPGVRGRGPGESDAAEELIGPARGPQDREQTSLPQPPGGIAWAEIAGVGGHRRVRTSPLEVHETWSKKVIPPNQFLYPILGPPLRMLGDGLSHRPPGLGHMEKFATVAVP
jgi:hypothetical protein